MGIIDFDALIDIKAKVESKEKWDTVLRLVEKGRLVFPKEVQDEVIHDRHLNMP